jgi:iron(III) transport system ATP-binding protein
VPVLTVEALAKTYPSRGADGPPALNGVSFDVAEGEFFTLLGPSGCGKTTTLQCIAGLETPSAGRIVMGGRTVCSIAEGIFVPPNRRDLGMVFQSYAIWPHMTVFDNVAFPLVHGPRKVEHAGVAPRVRKALARVQLEHLADRPAPLLSGGQQQRVALARALVHEPHLLLLDEPLSNLDAKLRDLMRSELRALVKSLGISTIFVTHDQVEAMGMSDRVALMRDGRIVQVGSPRDIYLKPQTAFTASFMGRSNLIAGRLQAAGLVDSAIGPVQVDASAAAIGAQVFVIARPQSIVFRPGAAADQPNRYPARVVEVSFLGDAIEIAVECNALRITLAVDSWAGIEMGAQGTIELPRERLVVVPHDAGVP